MPRHADRDGRRADLADAALSIALDQGLDRVTVPRIAAAAGVSVGLVQHYFPAKADLVVVAYERLGARVDERVAAIVQAGESAGGTIRQMMTAALEQFLPLDDARREEGRVRTEFAARALRDDALAHVAADLRRRLEARLAAAVDNGRECGETASGTVAGDAAAELLALSDGLAAGGLLGGDCGQARRLISHAVLRTLPGACRRGEGPAGS